MAILDDPGSNGTDVTRLRALIDGIDAVIYEVDSHGWVRFVNRRAVELFGYPKERWLSQPSFWQAIAYHADRPRVRDHFSSCSCEAPRGEIEYRIVAADGRLVWVRETLSAARDAAGRVESLRGVMVKIDEPTKGDRELRAARRQLADRLADMAHLNELSQRLWATLELQPLLTEILAATVAIQGAEMGMVRLYDPVRRDLRVVASVGMPDAFLERYRCVSMEQVACGQAIERGASVVIEDLEREGQAVAYQEPARIGGYRAKYSTLMKMRGGELLGTIATCFREPHRPSDRETELVELFARQAAGFVETARLVQELRDADRRKDEALAALAHEIRNPLNVILSGSHLMGLQAEAGSRSAKFCELVTRQAQLMARLADELIETSRLGRGKAPLNIESLDAGGAMAKAIESVTALVEERRHKLIVVPPPRDTRVEADPSRLEQILVNLLVNACRYTEPGGKITMDAWREDGKIAIRVQDTGVGISPEMVPRIFEPFVQANGDSPRVAGGLGLGLALVKSFAERQGGCVSVMSEGPGCGSEFIVRLPAAPARTLPVA